MNIFFRRNKRGAEELPVRRKSYYEDAFVNTDTGMIVYSKETSEIVDINKSVNTLFDLPDSVNWKGLYLSQIMMRHLSADSPNIEQLLNDKHVDWIGQVLFVTLDKREFYGLVNTDILAGSDSASDYRILSILDISALIKSREDAHTAQRKMEMASQSKARFLSSMSHELRTPLNGIIGAAELILSNNQPDGEIKEHISVIKYSSEHMLGIVNDILDFSKIDADKMTIKRRPFHLACWLDKIHAVFAGQFEKQRVEFVCDYHDERLRDLRIIGDETKLSQVLKNLLSNAMKFTNYGKVSLNVRPVEVKDSRIRLYFEISDTGIGIPEEKQAEIFQPFVQVYNEELKRQYDGSGLGLTISSQLVQMMGGNLQLKSALGDGSTFFFTLDFETETPSQNDAAEPVSFGEKDIKGIRVLIVEDNEINASILRSFLNRWKMPVKEAATGVHALELLKYHRFDLIFMDLEMPEMNGYTALGRIREMGISVPVLAFTATLLEDMDTLIDAGFTDYITKPFKPAELKRKIQKYGVRKIDYV